MIRATERLMLILLFVGLNFGFATLRPNWLTNLAFGFQILWVGYWLVKGYVLLDETASNEVLPPYYKPNPKQDLRAFLKMVLAYVDRPLKA